LFINQYYWPDHASTAQHLADLAETLAEEGYDCHVLCSRGTYKPGEARRPSREIHRGVHIHRVSATAFGRRSTLARMSDYVSFYAHALLQLLTMRRFDMVVTLTTPPLIGLVGTILQILKNSRHVYWSMDLHPDASLALGRMSARNPLSMVLTWLGNAVYRRADKVVALGSYMADRIVAKGVRSNRIATIPVWSRSDEVYPINREGHPLRRELGLTEKFVAMYSGNLGLAHAFEEFLEAACRLRHRPEVVFLFVGDGPRAAEVRAAIERDRLDNVRVMEYFPREQLHASLTVADVHLISMRKEMAGIVVPGKLYGVMASGRPALFVGPTHCETADTIREAECGFTVRLGDAQGVVEAIELLLSDLEVGRAMAERGRATFLDDHEGRWCCTRWSRLIGEMLGRSQMAVNLADQGEPPRSNRPAGRFVPSSHQTIRAS
jgi:glycosyltransferase involved in cell wall biosynthesis